MPLIYISVREGNSPEQKKKISEGVHQAMVDVLGLPEDDFNQVFLESSVENMTFDPNYFGMHRSPKAVFIQMFFNHRPDEMKARLFETIADNLVRDAGMRREDVLQTICETANANWWAVGRTIDEETGLDSRMSKRETATAA